MFNREKDIYYSLINKEFQDVLSFYYDNESERSLSKNIYKLLVRTVKQFVKNIKLLVSPAKKNTGDYKALQKPFWYYINTLNNQHALKYIFDHFAERSVFVTYGSADFTDNKVDLKKLYAPAPKWRALFFVYYLFLNPKYSIRRWRTIHDTFHLYDFYVEVLSKYKPQAIFFSNDHTPNSRALILAGKATGIKTIYLQHATVNKHFPPLRFSLSILDGEHSLQTYEAIGAKDGICECVGIPRLEIKPEHLVNRAGVSTIGIAFNMRDSIDKINDMVKHISQKYPSKTIVIRPHPRENRKMSYAQAKNVKFSDSTSESSLDYLSKLDLIIGNNSSILLEAAALNVFPLQYNFSNGEQTDSYGYIQHKVVTEVMSFEQLDELIENKNTEDMYYRNKAKFYDAAINTPHQYSVQAKVIAVVDDFISRN